MASTTDRRGNVKYSARSTKTSAMSDSSGSVDAGGAEANEVVHDHLEALARAGAPEMLMRALDEEVDAYLGRGRYERSGKASDAARLQGNLVIRRQGTVGTGAPQNPA